MICCAGISSALPHLFKLLVRRRRPDRTLARGRRKGIPRSGNAWDSFPSGHALHVGAIAPSLRRIAPPSLRPAVGPALLGLAASRILLLAHYPTDVIAGLAFGTVIDRAVALLPGFGRTARNGK